MMSKDMGVAAQVPPLCGPSGEAPDGSSAKPAAANAVLPEGLLEFVWDRLPIEVGAYDLARPSLAEDWFVADAIAARSPFRWRGRDAEVSHRLLYRHARAMNVERLCERGEYMRDPQFLLLNQMIALLPAVFGAAAAVFAAQAIEAPQGGPDAS